MTAPPVTFAHAVNPYPAPAGSEGAVAQPVTFETMRIARDAWPEAARVRLFSIERSGDPPAALPEGFVRLPPLTRSVSDRRAFRVPRPLPILKDILDALVAASDEEYLIYTNADIALQPHFYATAASIAREGYDAFAVNRRTIPATFRSLDEIPLMCAEIGEPHMGWDCFVFRRDLYPRFDLGEACIGTGWIGKSILANLSTLASRFRVFEELHATFHIGNDKAWNREEFSDYWIYNRSECLRILEAIERRAGPLDPNAIPGCFLREIQRATGCGPRSGLAWRILRRLRRGIFGS